MVLSRTTKAMLSPKRENQARELKVSVLITEVALAINVVTVRHLWMLNLNVERSAIIYRGVVGCQPIRDRCLVPLGVTGSEQELKFTNVGTKKFLLLKPRGNGDSGKEKPGVPEGSQKPIRRWTVIPTPATLNPATISHPKEPPNRSAGNPGLHQLRLPFPPVHPTIATVSHPLPATTAVSSGGTTAAVLSHQPVLLSRMCAKVRTVLFLPRRVLLTTVVSDRRDFPDYGGDRPRRSAAIAGRTRHG